MDKVAVVILNWNGEEMLRRFLPGVLAHTQAEIYVADNASTDKSLELLSVDFPAVKTILLERNYGFAEGYNRALAQIEAEYFVLLNSDVEVKDDWISPMLQYLDTHPEVAACQPKILSWHAPDKFEYAGAAGGYMDAWGYPYCRGRIMNTVETDEGQYDTVAPVFWATGAALMVRSAVYHEVGGLDARFFAHMEEIDLCWRLRARGRQLACIPQSVVFHVGGATLKKENPRKTFLNFRNNLVMLYKNLPQEDLASVMRVRAVLDYVAAFSFMLKGQLPNALAVFRARRAYHSLRTSLAASRKENLKKTTLAVIPERTKSSILAQFYLHGKKFFSQL